MKLRLESVLPWALTLACLVYDPRALADAPKRAFALLLSAALLVHLLVRAERLALPRATLALLGAIALIAVSAAYGSGARWLVLGNWWSLGGLALALGALDLEAARSVAARSALLVALGTSLLLLGAWLFGARGMQLHAGHGNPNWAGLVLAGAWPLALGDAVFSQRRRFLVAGFGALCAAAVALSESRVAWVALALAWASSMLRSQIRWRAAVQALLLGASIALTAVSGRSTASVSVRPVASAIARPAPELDRSARASLAGRIWIQRVTVKKAIANLPFGTGLGGFFSAFLEQQGRALERLTPRAANQRFSNATTAHDDWLELLLETGLFAPSLLLVGLVLAIRGSEAFAAASLVAVSTCALGDSPFHLPSVCVLVACVFGALPRPQRTLGARAVLALPTALAALLLGQAFAGWFASRCASAAHSEPPAQRLKLLERASRLQPESSEYALELGLARRDTGDLPGALRSLEQATALGGDVATFVALGNAALEGDEVARARAAFEGALARNPGSVRAHVGLGETLRRLGNVDEAERHTRIALELRPGDLELRARLDALHAQRMDRELDLDAPTESNLLGAPEDSR